MWVCLVSSLSGHPLVFLYLYICFLLSVGEVFSHSFFKYIFDPHLSSLFRTPIMHRLSCFTLSHRSCMLLSFFFPFVCLLFWLCDFLILSSRSLIHFSASFSLLFIAFRLVFILAVELSNFDSFLFIISSSLLQWSAFISIIFLNCFIIFITSLWRWGLVDWRGLFHCSFKGFLLF